MFSGFTHPQLKYIYIKSTAAALADGKHFQEKEFKGCGKRENMLCGQAQWLIMLLDVIDVNF